LGRSTTEKKCLRRWYDVILLEANEPVLIVRPNDGPIGSKHVALNVLFMVIIDVLDENINASYKL